MKILTNYMCELYANFTKDKNTYSWHCTERGHKFAQRKLSFHTGNCFVQLGGTKAV